MKQKRKESEKEKRANKKKKGGASKEKGGVCHWKCGRQALWLILGMTFVDDWVVGNEKVRYWLSNDVC